MAGVFNLRNVLELVVNGFNNPAFAQPQLVEQGDEPVFHSGPHVGDKRQALVEQCFKQRARDIAFVREEFAEQARRHAGVK